MRLVICNGAEAICKWCPHSTPHEVEERCGARCTEWEWCMIGRGTEQVKVRCTKVDDGCRDE